MAAETKALARRFDEELDNQCHLAVIEAHLSSAEAGNVREWGSIPHRRNRNQDTVKTAVP